MTTTLNLSNFYGCIEGKEGRIGEGGELDLIIGKVIAASTSCSNGSWRSLVEIEGNQVSEKITVFHNENSVPLGDFVCFCGRLKSGINPNSGEVSYHLSSARQRNFNGAKAIAKKNDYWLHLEGGFVTNTSYDEEVGLIVNTIAGAEERRIIVRGAYGQKIQVANGDLFISVGVKSKDGSLVSFTNKVVKNSPVVTQPAVTQPVVTQPVVTQPVVTQPVVTQPVVTQPVVTQPLVTQPVVTQAVVTQPAVTQAVVTQLVITQSEEISTEYYNESNGSKLPF